MLLQYKIQHFKDNDGVKVCGIKLNLPYNFMISYRKRQSLMKLVFYPLRYFLVLYL